MKKRQNAVSGELQKKIRIIASDKKRAGLRRCIAAGIVVVVGFAATYYRILPAISLYLQTSDEMAGICLEDSAFAEDMDVFAA